MYTGGGVPTNIAPLTHPCYDVPTQERNPTSGITVRWSTAPWGPRRCDRVGPLVKPCLSGEQVTLMPLTILCRDVAPFITLRRVTEILVGPDLTT
jgi:hypothetical protein